MLGIVDAPLGAKDIKLQRTPMQPDHPFPNSAADGSKSHDSSSSPDDPFSSNKSQTRPCPAIGVKHGEIVANTTDSGRSCREVGEVEMKRPASPRREISPSELRAGVS
jgi:hypothetical protein